ncbi:dTDP-glucose 4,6-dehydratase, partial [Archaeoglobales archaeon]
MKLLVTGGLGFIGSNFIRYYLEKSESDVEIINVDAMKYGSNPDNLKEIDGSNYNYTFVKGDISDYQLMSDLVKDVDAIVNFAAETHVDRSISGPEAFFKSNVLGVFTILEAIRKRNPEAIFVQVSTDEVYGDIVNGSFTENDALR